MKGDIKKTNFTKRVYADFTDALMELLQKKSLEEVSATELCQLCHYPRSTFYNYFEDIYFLMNCCWDSFAAEISLERFQEIPHEERTITLFEIIYSYMEEHRKVIEHLLRYNKEDGAMLRSLNIYMRRTISHMILECEASGNFPIPLFIVAEHYSNTVWMLLEQCFLKKESIGKDEALSCLNYLIGTLEKASTRT